MEEEAGELVVRGPATSAMCVSGGIDRIEADQIAATGARQPIVVIPNGLDVADFARPAVMERPIRTPLVANLTKRSRRILFLGRIHPKKGLMLLLPAWAGSASAQDWELVIAGPDEGGHLAEVRARAAELDLESRVTFTGWCRVMRSASLHSADLFVLPRTRGIAMSVLEALACECRRRHARKQCRRFDGRRCRLGLRRDRGLRRRGARTGRAQLRFGASRSRLGGPRAVEARYAWPSVVNELERACAAYC